MKNQARGFLSNDNGFELFQALHEFVKSEEEKKHINNKKAEKNTHNEKTYYYWSQGDRTLRLNQLR